VQQLESSRLKLTQLEQELQRARQQVCFAIYSLSVIQILILIFVYYFYSGYVTILFDDLVIYLF